MTPFAITFVAFSVVGLVVVITYRIARGDDVEEIKVSAGPFEFWVKGMRRRQSESEQIAQMAEMVMRVMQTILERQAAAAAAV